MIKNSVDKAYLILLNSSLLSCMLVDINKCKILKVDSAIRPAVT